MLKNYNLFTVNGSIYILFAIVDNVRFGYIKRLHGILVFENITHRGIVIIAGTVAVFCGKLRPSLGGGGFIKRFKPLKLVIRG